MSLSGKGRTLAMVLGLIAVMSLLLSASALAAGKPKGLIIGATKGANYLTLTATANPNGAATNVTFESWNSSKAEWQPISTVAIGSGTTAVTKEQFVGGLSTQTDYFYRFSAVNSFGTSVSAEETYYSYWSVEGFTEPHEAAFNSTGKFRMEYKTATGVSYKLECNQTGTGTINKGGNKDFVSVSATGCVEYVNGTSTCSQPNTFFSTEPGWTPQVIWYQPFPLCSGASEQYALGYTEPLRVSASGYGAHIPVVMTTAKAQYGNTKFVTVTIESTWTLQSGKSFGLITE